MIDNAPELQNKIKMSWYLFIGCIALSFVFGGVIVGVLDNDKQRESDKQFLLEEIQGLRSDWERQYDQNVNKRLDKLEKKVENLK